MLLGAARYLAETRRFDGTVYFIFQPAEENEGGGRVMVEEGLFERFPMESVYGMHNWPGEPAGRFAVRPGPMMASFDIFEVVLTGRGTHAAMPHLGVDAVVAAAQVVQALQTITARNTDPQDAVVVSVTQIHGGDTWNVIPEEVVLRGTCRSFKPEVQDATEARLRQIAESTATAYGVDWTVDLAEARKHREHVLKSCPGLVPIRIAELLPVVVTPYRFGRRALLPAARNHHVDLTQAREQAPQVRAVPVVFPTPDPLESSRSDHRLQFLLQHHLECQPDRALKQRLQILT